MLYDVYNDYSNMDFSYYEPLKFNYLNSQPTLNINIPLGNSNIITIPLNVGIKINPNDKIVAQAPTEHTEALKGSRAYNLETMESWLCTDYERVNNAWIFNWVKDEQMYQDRNGTVFHAFPDSYYENKTAIINIYNFRYELLGSVELTNISKIIYLDVSDEVINTCFKNRNSYQCEVVLKDIEDNGKTVILPNNFKINIL